MPKATHRTAVSQLRPPQCNPSGIDKAGALPPQKTSLSLTRLAFRLTHPSGHPSRLPASYKRGLFSVYQDSTELSQHEQDYENWSSLQLPLDFSEFLNQDFSHHNELPGSDYSVSGANFDIDFEALLASTSPSNSQTATTTTDSSATLTPVDFSTRQDNASFDPLNPTSTILFDPSQALDSSTQSSHVSTGSSSMRFDIPTSSSFTTTFPSQQSSQQRPTPPPSVSTAERASKSTSPAAATGKTGPASPTTSDSPGDGVGPESRKRKRERNTEAARRYRQRRQDRLEELEEALAAMTKDRDDLRIKLARSEAETDILRGLMAKK
jgi:hypothetical protein